MRSNRSQHKEKFSAYPMVFKPVFKKTVWGGRKLRGYMNIPSGRIGEVWFGAHTKETSSVVANGKYRNIKLSFIMKKYSKEMLGREVSKKAGGIFPLMVKFIDAKKLLSVQVHPDNRGPEKGKTEMWKVLKTSGDSFLYLGMKRKAGARSIKELIRGGKLPGILKKYGTKQGDSFIVPSGAVHAIGPGNLICEIQQNSDITYRIYDWGRENTRNARKMNVDKALRYLKKGGEGRLKGKRTKKKGFSVTKLITRGPFRVSEVSVENRGSYWFNEKTPALFAVTSGRVILERGGKKLLAAEKGSVFFIPDSMGGFIIKAAQGTQYLTAGVRN